MIVKYGIRLGVPILYIQTGRVKNTICYEQFGSVWIVPGTIDVDEN